MSQLTVNMDGGLLAEVTAHALQHGLPADEYAAAVLRAAIMPGDERENRATELARAALQQWNDAGRPQAGAMSMAEVFGS
ncbi:hypothetical protein ACFVHW_03960 [Streptomyces sp. NPDC127110]|uniref:hypothetical protein n=1 Tax=Streptomyces sp. NPDC127110 TaxID=3345362 RepID=UPI003635B442